MFYRAVTPPAVSEDAATVMRQALAGMLWSKQCYFFDVDKWLEEHGAEPMHLGSRTSAAIVNGNTYGQPRRHLYARQMGISLVCLVGPGAFMPWPCRRWMSILPSSSSI